MERHYVLHEFNHTIRVPRQGIIIHGEKLPKPLYPEVERILISKKCIQKRVEALAREIAKDYKGKDEIYCLVILKGGIVFFADLLRAFHRFPEIKHVLFDAVEAKSYLGTESSGNVKLRGDVNDVKGKEILIVEDIIDTGITMDRLKRFLLEKGAKKVRVCALLDKPERRKVPVDIDYLGFEIPNLFVVGYGIDFEEKYRALPHIAYIRQ